MREKIASEMGNKRSLFTIIQMFLTLIFLFNKNVSECCSRGKNDDQTPTVDDGMLEASILAYTFTHSVVFVLPQ